MIDSRSISASNMPRGASKNATNSDILNSTLSNAQEGHYFSETSFVSRSYSIYMLPHSRTWIAIAMTSIVVNVLLQCITFTYQQTLKKKHLFYFTQYGLEAIYAMYLIFTILHRNLSIHKNDFCSRKMPFLHLLIGMISIVPYCEIYENLLMREQHLLLNHLLKLKVIIRLCHVYAFFAQCRGECGKNRMLFILIETLVINSIYICMVSCIIGWLGCYGCEFSNWTTHLKDVLYYHENLHQRPIYPIVFIGSLLLGNYSGVLLPETIPEISCILLTMVVSFVIKIHFMLAHLINEYVTFYWKSSKFKIRTKKIHNFIEFENLSKSLKNDIIEYTNVLWVKRSGILRPNLSFFDLMPSSLTNEIKLDLSWDALTHSHLFRDQPLPVKTAIAELMQNRFMKKGDVIYVTGDLKDSLIYIVSGIVQLLSDEDDESPILSFSSGTVISEYSCLMLGKSDYKLHCASYCELRVLTMTDFYRGMTFYRKYVRDFQQMLNDRIDFARSLKRRKNLDLQYDMRTTWPIRRIKLQWHNIIHGKLLVDPCHTSKYMDLLALGDDMELKVEVVCLTSKFPLIMDPHSSFRRFCEIIVFIACLIETAIIPFYAAFYREISTALRSFLLLLDFVYVLDIYLQITTAVEEKDIMVVKFTAILLHRIQQMTFIVDLIATLPIDYIYWAQGCTPRLFIMLKIPRVLKIYKLFQLIRKFEKSMLEANGVLVLQLKYYMLWIISVYLFTCLFFVTSCYTTECIQFSWYPYNMELSNQTNSNIYPVMTSLLYVVDLMSHGKKSIYAYNYSDSLMSLVLIIIAYYLIPFAIAEIAANHYWEVHEVAFNKALISSMLNYTHIHKICSSIANRVSNTLRFRWKHNRGLIKLSICEFFSELPVKLEERIREEMIGQLIDKQVFFQTLDENVRRRVLHMANVISYPEGDVIIRENMAISHLYIIKRGMCRIQTLVPGDVERNTSSTIYTTGAFFPVIEVMHCVPSFLKVVTLTTVDAIVIPHDTFLKAFKDDKAYFASMMGALKSHMDAHWVTLSRSQRLNSTIRVKPVKKPNYFKYKINDNIEVEAKKTKFILRTINPHSRPYLIYEILHCFLVIFQFVILTLQMNLLYEYRYIIQKLNITCDVLNWMDIIIRLRLQYYRNDGILITDYRAVAKYYLGHSFAVDFYASCPFSTFSIDSMITLAHPVAVKHFLLIFSRPFQLYRVFLGISYLCNRGKLISEANTVRFQCFLSVMVILLIGSNLLVLSTCTMNFDSILCPMISWTGGDITEITTMTSLAHYGYLTALYLYVSPFNRYAIESNFSYAMYVVYTVIFLSLWWILVSKLISLNLHGQFMTSQLQNDRTHFQTFAKLEGINAKLSERLLQVNAFLTRDTEINAIRETNKRLAPEMQRGVAFTLNQTSFKKNRLFVDIAEYIQRHLTSEFQGTFYMKDDVIIRNNDINKYLFIVKKGCVAISIAGCKLAVLGTGGMFGCISDKERIRQTIDANAVMHTEIIYIKTKVFNRYIYNYDIVKHRMKAYIIQNMEYVGAVAEKDGEESAVEVVIGSSPYTRLFDNIHKSFGKSGKGFAIYFYLMHVHLSTFSTMFSLVYQLVAMHENLTLPYFIILYSLDSLFLLKILLGFVLPFVDVTSGLLIINSQTIALRYLKKEFALDIVCVLMPELCFGFLFSREFYIALLTSNRLLRIIYLIRYYNSARRENRLTHILRWVFLAYLMIICIQCFTNVWYFVACTLRVCRYRKFISHEVVEYVPMLTSTHTYLYSYVHVVNVFTGNSLKATNPLNVEEILLTLVIVIFSLFMMATISSGYAFVQIIDNNYLGYYRNQLSDVKAHLTNLRISPYILQKVVRYYEFIWNVQRGDQWPNLITETNRYLREDIMQDLYSEMILKTVIFKNTHKDFFRQLLVYVKRVVYSRAMIIVQQNEVDGKMYFIQSGNVGMTEGSDWKNMRKVGILSPGQSFGVVQGLTVAPHDYTYIAETLVVVLSLKKKDWAYLLNFFPATLNDIQQSLNDYFGITDRV